MLSLFRFIDTHVLTWFQIVYWFIWFLFKSLLVIAYSWMPELHHLIICMCDCLSTPIGFILCTRWVAFWQPWTFMSGSRSLDHGDLTVADQSGSAEVWINGGHRSFFLPAFLLIGYRDSSCCSLAPLMFWLCITFCKSYFCILWWCNILVILYHFLW